MIRIHESIGKNVLGVKKPPLFSPLDADLRYESHDVIIIIIISLDLTFLLLFFINEIRDELKSMFWRIF